jgi:hypothetical protein
VTVSFVDGGNNVLCFVWTKIKHRLKT